VTGCYAFAAPVPDTPGNRSVLRPGDCQVAGPGGVWERIRDHHTTLSEVRTWQDPRSAATGEGPAQTRAG